MSDAKITVAGGKALRNMAKQLRDLSDGKARAAFARALERGGNMGRAQLYTSLTQTTGISKQKIKEVITTTRPTASSLVYTLRSTGAETNISLFQAKQLKKGVKASPWKKRRMFKSTFIVPAYGGGTYAREGKERGPLKGIWGPNIGREMTKEPNTTAWERGALNGVERRLLHEIGRLL